MKFRERLNIYTKAPPFPRPRGMRFNRPDAVVGRISNTVSDSLSTVSYSNGNIVVAKDLSINLVIPHQRVYPFSMEQSSSFFNPQTKEYFICATAWDNSLTFGAGYGEMSYWTFDGSAPSTAAVTYMSAGYPFDIESTSASWNNNNGFALVSGFNTWWFDESQIIQRWNINDSSMVRVPSDYSNWYSGSYVGNGILSTGTNWSQFIPWDSADRCIVNTSGPQISFIKSSGTDPVLWGLKTTGSAQIGPMDDTVLSSTVQMKFTAKPVAAQYNKIGADIKSDATFMRLINEAGKTYYYTLSKSTPFSSLSRRIPYTGNGTDNYVVYIQTDTPEFVILKNYVNTNPNEYAVFWTKDMPNDETAILGPVANQTGVIHGSDGLGFDRTSFQQGDTSQKYNLSAGGSPSTLGGFNQIRLGNSNYINKLNVLYEGFGNGLSKYRGTYYDYGTYIGNGSSQTITLDFQNAPKNVEVEWMLIKGNNTGHPQIRWQGLPNSTSISGQFNSDGITSFSNSGFTVGNSVDVNESGIAYYWIVIAKDAEPIPFQIGDPVKMAYNYNDQKLYWWQQTGANTNVNPDINYGTLVKYNHDTNQIEFVARSSFTYTTETVGEIYSGSRCIYFNNKLYWMNTSYNVFEFDELTHQTSLSFSYSSFGLIPVPGSNGDLIVFGDSLYAVTEAIEAGVTKIFIFKNDGSGWVIDERIILNANLFQFGSSSQYVFGTLWPEGAIEPTELYIAGNFDGGSYYGTDHDDPSFTSTLSGSSGTVQFLIWRKVGSSGTWEFDARIDEGAVTGSVLTEFEDLQEILNSTRSGTGAAKTYGLLTTPKLIVFAQTRTSGVATTTQPAHFWTSDMDPDKVATFTGAGEVSGLFTDVTDISLTISGDINVNGSGKSYKWDIVPEIIRGSRRVATGYYGGNSTDDREIYTPFPVGLVWVKSRGSEMGHWRIPEMANGKSMPFGSGGLQDNRIKTNSVTSPYKYGFTIGNHDDVNNISKTYYWVAFSSDVCFTTKWEGNEQNRVILTNKAYYGSLWFSTINDTICETLVRFDEDTRPQYASGTANSFVLAAPRPSYNYQNLYISATSLWNVGGRDHYGAGIGGYPYSWFEMVGPTSFFSIRGRMCMMVQSAGGHTGIPQFRYMGMIILSRSPDGKWGILDSMLNSGNDHIPANPSSNSTNAYFRMPYKEFGGYYFTGQIAGTVVGPFRDQNKQ